MEFRLTYAGPLHAVQRDPMQGQPAKHADERHNIRRIIHGQMKRLWGELASLRGDSGLPNVIVTEGHGRDFPVSDIAGLAARHCQFGFNFVPLVTTEMDLLCSLDILFLRPDRPGKTVWAGDIDNRIENFLDALRVPEAHENYFNRVPQNDEKPFFCLLEDDKLITRLSVDTDRLLEPVDGGFDAHNARLVVTVKLRPYEFHLGNMHFG